MPRGHGDHNINPPMVDERERSSGGGGLLVVLIGALVVLVGLHGTGSASRLVEAGIVLFGVGVMAYGLLGSG